MAKSKERKEAVTFEGIIQKARQKKKNEQFAEKFFGQKREAEKYAAQILGSKSRTPSGPASNGPGATLASRVGVNKRPQKPKPTAQLGSSTITRPRTQPRTVSNHRITSISQAVNGASSTARAQANVSDAIPGISVRGMGGSYTVVAQNFAPGTTAADIEAVLAPDIEQCLTSCRLLASVPTVIAELVFGSRDAAQAVITRFNNKTADGRLLHVWMKEVPQNRASQLRNFNSVLTTRGGPRVRAQAQKQEVIDVDSHEEAQIPTGPRRAAPEYQDGSYGFSEDYDSVRNSYNAQRTERRGRGREGGLISDNIMNVSGRKRN